MGLGTRVSTGATSDEQGVLLAKAVAILRRGGLVAFPTETVYGLGADATNSEAVNRIYTAKGRPAGNPLIVHVTGIESARRYARYWPPIAEHLAAEFWPGPLALVLQSQGNITPEARGGLSTVALRAPNHPLALELLRRFGGPVAAPSANRSMRVSPTTPEHVRSELGDAVDLILEGGHCDVGIESTVLDLTRPRPMILRPGGATREAIESVIGPVDLLSGEFSETQTAASPGQQAVHYSPMAPAYRFNDQNVQILNEFCQLHPGENILIMAIRRFSFLPAIIHMPDVATDYARRFYAVLHETDERNPVAIWIEEPPDAPPWQAVRDRIRRATRPAEEAQ